MPKTVLVPLPDRDFDTTEVAVPWKLLTERGHRVVFATERGGEAPETDPLLLRGVLFGQLGAEPEPKRFYREMEEDPAFRKPISWASVQPAEFDGLLLPGGHAPGMKQYLGSAELQWKVVQFWRTQRPVAAICHGTLVLARSIEPETRRSVLWKERTTCLPYYMEEVAWRLTRWKLGDYYRTYPLFVEEEVRGALESPASQFLRGPVSLVRRGTREDHRAAFVVQSGRYLSARWPGDAYLFAERFAEML